MEESYDDGTANDYLDMVEENVSGIKTLIHKLDNLNISQDTQDRYANIMSELYDFIQHL